MLIFSFMFSAFCIRSRIFSRPHVHRLVLCDIITLRLSPPTSSLRLWLYDRHGRNSIFLFLPIWFSFLRCEYFHIFLWWTSYCCSHLYVLLWRVYFFISMRPWGNRGQRGERKQWPPGLGKGRNCGWPDQKAVNYFIASISLPSGNSGNGIKSWCEAWPQGQTRLQSGRTFNLLRDHTLLL